MNNWQGEFMAECHRQRIRQEVEQIRLERLALNSRAARPRLLERTMFNVADWMISAGTKLRKHYEISKEERWISPRTKATS